MAGEQTPAAAPAAAPAASPAPAPGTPAYDAAMAAKVDAAAASAAAAAAGDGAPAPAAKPERPAHIPEKFWNAEKGEVNVEAMAKSYTELERTRGQPATPPATPPADPAKPDSKLGIPPAEDANKAVQNAGLDMAALQQEWNENGDLKPETYTKLEQSGIPKPMVDAYIAGQRALSAEYDAAAYATAGGQEQYGQMVSWARTGLAPAEQEAFNAAVTSNNKATMQLAVSGLKARMSASAGQPPANPLGGKPAAAGDVYESMAQVTADMKKPEYKNDPAFRAKVMAKLDRSDIGSVKVLGMS